MRIVEELLKFKNQIIKQNRKSNKEGDLFLKHKKEDILVIIQHQIFIHKSQNNIVVEKHYLI